MTGTQNKPTVSSAIQGLLWRLLIQSSVHIKSKGKLMIPNQGSSKKRHATEYLQSGGVKHVKHNDDSSPDSENDQPWPELVLSHLGIEKDDMHVFLSNITIFEGLMAIYKKYCLSKESNPEDKNDSAKEANSHEFPIAAISEHPELLSAIFIQLDRLGKNPGNELIELALSTPNDDSDIIFTNRILNHLLENVVKQIRDTATFKKNVLSLAYDHQLAIKTIVAGGTSALNDPTNLNYKPHPLFVKAHALESRLAYAKECVANLFESAKVSPAASELSVEELNRILATYEEEKHPEYEKRRLIVALDDLIVTTLIHKQDNFETLLSWLDLAQGLRTKFKLHHQSCKPVRQLAFVVQNMAVDAGNPINKITEYIERYVCNKFNYAREEDSEIAADELLLILAQLPPNGLNGLEYSLKILINAIKNHETNLNLTLKLKLLVASARHLAYTSGDLQNLPLIITSELLSGTETNIAKNAWREAIPDLLDLRGDTRLNFMKMMAETVGHKLPIPEEVIAADEEGGITPGSLSSTIDFLSQLPERHFYFSTLDGDPTQDEYVNSALDQQIGLMALSQIISQSPIRSLNFVLLSSIIMKLTPCIFDEFGNHAKWLHEFSSFTYTLCRQFNTLAIRTTNPDSRKKVSIILHTLQCAWFYHCSSSEEKENIKIFHNINLDQMFHHQPSFYASLNISERKFPQKTSALLILYIMELMNCMQDDVDLKPHGIISDTLPLEGFEIFKSLTKIDFSNLLSSKQWLDNSSILKTSKNWNQFSTPSDRCILFS